MPIMILGIDYIASKAMARPVILGNNSLTVGLNEIGLVQDFYYPYVGLENLTNSRLGNHRIGVWVDGSFSWVHDSDWQSNVDFDNDALISSVRLVNDKLSLELHLRDFVDYEHNAFIRKISAKNTTQQKREVRIFMHQVFQISQYGRGDTALFVPDENYILDYKGRCCLLIYGQNSDKQPFDQYAVGNYGIEGKEGTYRDAEDGELSNNAVEHAGVDSVIRLKAVIEPESLADFDYWIVATNSQYRAEEIHKILLSEGTTKRIGETIKSWHNWLAIGKDRFSATDKKYHDYITKSLMIIKAHTDKRGGIIASCDSSIYNYGRDFYSYVWPRDGAYAIWPLIRLGYKDEPKQFFEFCRDILTPEGFLMHKYQPDRAVGSTWHPLVHDNHKELAIQEDETAIVLYMIGEYLEEHNDEDYIEGLYETLIKPAANFLDRFYDDKTNLPHASYDLWEEKFATHTYTVAITYQALLVASDIAERFQYADDALRWKETAQKFLAVRGIFYDSKRSAFRKSFLLKADGSLQFDNTLDISSLYAVVMFGYHANDLDKISSTVENIESQILNSSPSMGAARYENDNYFLSKRQYTGNPWFVTTLWMAQYYLRAKNNEKAYKCLNWVLEHSLPSKVLSEQVDPETGTIVSVAPLVWSHAELVNTILDLN